MLTFDHWAELVELLREKALEPAGKLDHARWQLCRSLKEGELFVRVREAHEAFMQGDEEREKEHALWAELAIKGTLAIEWTGYSREPQALTILRINMGEALRPFSAAVCWIDDDVYKGLLDDPLVDDDDWFMSRLHAEERFPDEAIIKALQDLKEE